jgi:hypothetical protein
MPLSLYRRNCRIVGAIVVRWISDQFNEDVQCRVEMVYGPYDSGGVGVLVNNSACHSMIMCLDT